MGRLALARDRALLTPPRSVSAMHRPPTFVGGATGLTMTHRSAWVDPTQVYSGILQPILERIARERGCKVELGGREQALLATPAISTRRRGERCGSTTLRSPHWGGNAGARD